MYKRQVLNLTVSPFNDATTSYHHRSVGGYHGAKLARYQDLIDRYLVQLDPNVLDMLNTRYVIRPGDRGEPVAERRPTANGAAWLVRQVRPADGAEAEIAALDGLDTRRTAVVDRKFVPLLAGLAQTATAAAQIELPADTTAAIRLAEYRPQYQRYDYRSSVPSLAVFSEIYYPDGWIATIDGEPADIARADYILRSMYVPAGKHTIEMRFDPKSLHVTEGIAYAALALMVIGIMIMVIVYKKRLSSSKS